MGRHSHHEQDIKDILNVISDAMRNVAEQVYAKDDVDAAIEAVREQIGTLTVSKEELMQGSGVYGSTFYSRNPYHHITTEYSSATYLDNRGCIKIDVAKYLKNDYDPDHEDDN